MIQAQHVKEPSAPASGVDTEGLSPVNLAARQRMLSQRLALQIVLAASGQAEQAEAAAQTLRLFADSHARILALVRDPRLPAAEARALQALYFGAAGVSAMVDAFIADCRAALQPRPAGQAAGPALAAVVGRVDSVLAALNSATSAFDQIGTRKEANLVRQMGEIVEEIRLVAREARVVSFNAQVIAARAGAVGREFSVVAGTLSRISNEVDKLASKGLTLVQG